MIKLHLHFAVRTSEVVIGTIFYVWVWFTLLRWAELGCLLFLKDPLLPGTRWAGIWRQLCMVQVTFLWKQCRCVGKAVWNTIVLLNLSGPAEPHNRPFFVFLSHTAGEQRLLHWQFPLSNAIRRKQKLLSFSCVFYCIFSISSCFYCFDPKWVLWLSAGWN